MTDKLKPCPFCKPKIIKLKGQYRIDHEKKCFLSRYNGIMFLHGDRLKEWNTRPKQIDAEKLKEYLNDSATNWNDDSDDIDLALNMYNNRILNFIKQQESNT